MNKQTKPAQATVLAWHEKVVGYIALGTFTVGTLRAAQLEASRSSDFVYLVSILVVIFSLQAVAKLIKR